MRINELTFSYVCNLTYSIRSYAASSSLSIVFLASRSSFKAILSTLSFFFSNASLGPRGEASGVLSDVFYDILDLYSLCFNLNSIINKLN